MSIFHANVHHARDTKLTRLDRVAVVVVFVLVCFTTLHGVLKNLATVNQSEVKLKPVKTFSLTFSRASRVYLYLLQILIGSLCLTPVVIGQDDYCDYSIESRH